MSDDASADANLAPADDLRVAAVAAGCAIGLTLALQYGVGRDVAVVYRTVPLVPYVLSLAAGRVGLGRVDTPRTWSALTVVVTLVAFVVFGLL